MMTYNDLIQEAMDRFPEFREEVKRGFETGEIDESLGPYSVFSFYLIPIFRRAIESEDDKYLQDLFEFVEEMEACEDHHVGEVAEFEILEQLCDDYQPSRFWKYLGPLTKEGCLAVTQYMGL